MLIILTCKFLIQGIPSIQEISYDTSATEFNVPNIVHHKDNGTISHKFEVLPLDYKSK